jgi:hypothetical protein
MVLPPQDTAKVLISKIVVAKVLRIKELDEASGDRTIG